jgi:hypothetical protein
MNVSVTDFAFFFLDGSESYHAVMLIMWCHGARLLQQARKAIVPTLPQLV